jgi:hypothetical protein
VRLYDSLLSVSLNDCGFIVSDDSCRQIRMLNPRLLTGLHVLLSVRMCDHRYLLLSDISLSCGQGLLAHVLLLHSRCSLRHLLNI